MQSMVTPDTLFATYATLRSRPDVAAAPKTSRMPSRSRQKRADDRSGAPTRRPGADRCLTGVRLLRRGRAACRAKSWFASSHTHALERAAALLTCQYLEFAGGMDVCRACSGLQVSLDGRRVQPSLP